MPEANTGKTTKSTWGPLIILGVAVFLAPITLLYFFAVFFGLITMAAPPPLDIEAIEFLVGGGYGISALWWLVHKYRQLSLTNITVRIWVGLAIGIFISAMFILNHYAEKTPRQGWIYFNEFWVWLIFGGPVLLVLTLLAYIALRKSEP